MKKILIFLIFVSVVSFAMEQQPPQEKAKEHKKSHRDYALINSFLDAYLAPNFYEIRPNGVTFTHYEDDPLEATARRYSLTFEKGAKILYHMQRRCYRLGNTAQDRLFELEKDLQDGKDISERDKNIAMLFSLQQFCSFIDLQWAADAADVNARRLIYQAAWATHDSTKIIEALKYDHKLHSKKDPYVFFRHQIDDVKKGAASVLKEIEEDRTRQEHEQQCQKAASAAIKGKKNDGH